MHPQQAVRLLDFLCQSAFPINIDDNVTGTTIRIPFSSE